MFDKQSQKFILDYVYKPIDAEDTFRNVQIECSIVEENLSFKISADEEICDADLVSIIKSLQKSNFDKIKINIIKDCDVIFKCVDKSFSLIFNQENGDIIARNLT